MKSIGQRATFLAMCAVFATALMSAAATLWAEELTLSATLTTGEVNASLACSALTDNESTGWAQADYPAPNPLQNAGAVSGSASSDGYAFNLDIANAYPGYAVLCKYKLKNNGTVPWHLEVEALKATLPDGATLLSTCNGTLCSLGDVSPTSNDGAPIYARMNDIRGCQLHKYESKEGEIFIGINRSAETAGAYGIEIKLRVNQWNESDWLSCGIDNPLYTGPVLPQH